MRPSISILQEQIREIEPAQNLSLSSPLRVKKLLPVAVNSRKLKEIVTKLKKTPILAFFCGVYIFLYAMIGFFAFPTADDYLFQASLMEREFWLSQYHWYTSWTGRFTNSFLLSAVSIPSVRGMFVTLYRFLPSLWIALSLASIYFCVKSILRTRIKESMLISIFFQALWLNQMPMLHDSLYWLAGAPYYITCCIILFAVGFVAKLIREDNVVFDIAALSILAILNSGMIEVGAVFLLIMLVVVQLFCVFTNNWKKAKHLIIPVLFCVIGLCAVYFSPGTEIRLKGTSHAFGRETANLLVFIKMTIMGGIPFAIDVLLSPLKYLFLLFLPDMQSFAKKRVVFANPLRDRAKIWHAVVLTVIGAFCFQTITAYAFASPLPPRGESTAAWALWLCWIFYFVFLYDGDRLVELHGSFIYRVRYPLAVICFILSFNSRDAVSSAFSASDYYSQQMSRRSIIMSTSSAGTAYVPIISDKYRLLHLQDDIGHKAGIEDGSSWVNELIAKCYGIKRVYGIPKILYNSGVTDEFSDEEYLDALRKSSYSGDAYSTFSLARIYDTGRLGVTADVDEALRLYELAFAGGESLAARSLFRIYLMDKRRAPEYSKAAKNGLRYLFNRYICNI
ncbi:MAG: DUF6056 family protein [Synergistaceae bacterium]|jgi:hypothetical protein|nr:DUF6056 family protein [Synergistaceae bacterium]